MKTALFASFAAALLCQCVVMWRLVSIYPQQWDDRDLRRVWPFDSREGRLQNFSSSLRVVKTGDTVTTVFAVLRYVFGIAALVLYGVILFARTGQP